MKTTEYWQQLTDTEKLVLMTKARDCIQKEVTEMNIRLENNDIQMQCVLVQFKQLKEVLEKIAEYPKTPMDELGYEGCRKIAKSALEAINIRLE